ncbi:hypothetical protein IWX75_002235 [Arthrobacter sp. CAN_A6]|uniref:MerR family DNA-binding transcriptional regulator n=1 Tax=Arthrobacter sp. CAN_A6 TaxID=2787721 RepID=UPI001A1823C3
MSGSAGSTTHVANTFVFEAAPGRQIAHLPQVSAKFTPPLGWAVCLQVLEVCIVDGVSAPTIRRTYTIKEAAALTGLPASTLRYYESIGVITPMGLLKVWLTRGVDSF